MCIRDSVLATFFVRKNIKFIYFSSKVSILQISLLIYSELLHFSVYTFFFDTLVCSARSNNIKKVDREPLKAGKTFYALDSSIAKLSLQMSINGCTKLYKYRYSLNKI